MYLIYTKIPFFFIDKFHLFLLIKIKNYKSKHFHTKLTIYLIRCNYIYLLYNRFNEKDLYFFFFLFFSNKSFSHPLGINDDTLDSNFKCVGVNNLNKEINFGLKEYIYQKEGTKFLLSIPFNNKLKKYNVPASAVYEFGTYTINNIVYDNMQMWFDHGYLGSNIYVFRRALVKKKDAYMLNDSLFNSTKLIQKKLDKLKNKIIDKSNKDYDKAANLIKKYGNVAFSYVLKNDDETFFKNFKFKCVLE